MALASKLPVRHPSLAAIGAAAAAIAAIAVAASWHFGFPCLILVSNMCCLDGFVL